MRFAELGQSQIGVEGLLEDVRTAIESAFADIETWSPLDRNSNAFWTSRLMDAMDRLARATGLDLRRSGGGSGREEFLYDVVFLDTPRSDNPSGYFRPGSHLKRLVIALECEWNTSDDEIVYDFTKLLVARASLRVFVFWQRTPVERERIFQSIEAVIHDFEDGARSDTYLVIGIAGAQCANVVFDGLGRKTRAPVSAR
jgi:hypothetical protein